MKAWYQSKLIWLGILITLQGAIPLVQEMLAKGPVDSQSVLALVSGILVIVIRVWFTDSQIG